MVHHSRRRGTGRHGTGWIVGGAMVAAALLLAATVGGHGAAVRGTAVLTSTPPPLTFTGSDTSQSAHSVLEALAARAEALVTPPSRGRYTYVRTEGWYLFSEGGDARTRSATVPSTTETWQAPDGSGRLRRVYGDPSFTSAASARSWRRQGIGRPQPVDSRVGPGGMPFQWPPGTLSADPAVLRTQLAQGHPVAGGAAEVLVAIQDLYRQEPVPPPVQAAVLRILAGLPGLRYDGRTTDRAGRPGVAVSLDSSLGGLPERTIMVLDPATGRLLDAEGVLTRSPGKLDVRVPAVAEYTVFLDAGTRASDQE